MDWQEISVETSKEAVEATAELFNELGSGGVIIEDPELLFQMTASGRWDDFELSPEELKRHFCVIRGYLPINALLAAKYEELKIGINEIAVRLQQEPGRLVLKKVNEEDWANSWKAYFKPLKIGQRLVVRPTWESYIPGQGELVLDLDPGMAFGTGSHITTIMCARFLEQYLVPCATVIDVGTGTGILAMAAARLGAKEVLAVDNDDVAVKTARENIRQNGLADIVRVEQGDLLKGISLKADLISANIIAAVIIRLFLQARECLNNEGLLLVSGIIADRREDVFEAGRQAGYVLLAEDSDKDWVAQVWQRQGC
jgi:ribosomal protein L11 methyltransferase